MNPGILGNPKLPSSSQKLPISPKTLPKTRQNTIAKPNKPKPKRRMGMGMSMTKPPIAIAKHQANNVPFPMITMELNHYLCDRVTNSGVVLMFTGKVASSSNTQHRVQRDGSGLQNASWSLGSCSQPLAKGATQHFSVAGAVEEVYCLPLQCCFACFFLLPRFR
jgi:hypothetical protein